MKFNDTIDKQGIVQDVWFILFGDDNDHSADYSLAAITRNANKWYNKVVAWILQADQRFSFDDANATDLPIAGFDLVANQQDYGIASVTFLKVKKVDALDQNGNGVPLTNITLDDLRGTAEVEFMKTAGTPQYYRESGSSVFLYPKPNYSYTKGLRVFYQRNVSLFVSTDTTKVPGFAENFHPLISMGAAYEAARTSGMKDKVTTLTKDIADMKTDLQEFYSSRNAEKLTARLQKADYGEINMGGGKYQNYPFGFRRP